MAYNIQPLRTQQEINDVLMCLDQTEFPKRNKFLVLFSINVGLRMSDIVKLKVGDIRNNTKPIIIEQKTSKKRRLYLSSIQDLINDYCYDKRDSDWLFPSRVGHNHLTVNGVYRMLRTVRQQLGRDDIGTHTMRKTYGYWFYKSTHDLATLQLLFNHSSENITKRYIGVTEDDMENSLRGFKIGY